MVVASDAMTEAMWWLTPFPFFIFFYHMFDECHF
jgi:hypothetical protein